MNCPNCSHENPPRARFCVECGTPFVARCHRCSAELPPLAKFCLNCGAAQAQTNANSGAEASADATSVEVSAGPSESILLPRTTPDGERRQLTVMFCDMVGFTALVSRVDPEILQNIVSKVSGAGEVSGGCPVPELTYLD